MVFLRPTLVRNGSDSGTYTGERYDYIRGEQIKAKPTPDAVLPEVESPVLAPRPVVPPPAPVKNEKPEL
jgi:general secretion pathway protein D